MKDYERMVITAYMLLFGVGAIVSSVMIGLAVFLCWLAVK